MRPDHFPRLSERAPQTPEQQHGECNRRRAEERRKHDKDNAEGRGREQRRRLSRQKSHARNRAVQKAAGDGHVRQRAAEFLHAAERKTLLKRVKRPLRTRDEHAVLRRDDAHGRDQFVFPCDVEVCELPAQISVELGNRAVRSDRIEGVGSEREIRHVVVQPELRRQGSVKGIFSHVAAVHPEIDRAVRNGNAVRRHADRRVKEGFPRGGIEQRQIMAALAGTVRNGKRAFVFRKVDIRDVGEGDRTARALVSGNFRQASARRYFVNADPAAGSDVGARPVPAELDRDGDVAEGSVFPQQRARFVIRRQRVVPPRQKAASFKDGSARVLLLSRDDGRKLRSAAVKEDGADDERRRQRGADGKQRAVQFLSLHSNS